MWRRKNADGYTGELEIMGIGRHRVGLFPDRQNPEIMRLVWFPPDKDAADQLEPF
jgi:hypothetical protein